jgi:hypothetical protein
MADVFNLIIEDLYGNDTEIFQYIENIRLNNDQALNGHIEFYTPRKSIHSDWLNDLPHGIFNRPLGSPVSTIEFSATADNPLSQATMETRIRMSDGAHPYYARIRSELSEAHHASQTMHLRDFVDDSIGEYKMSLTVSDPDNAHNLLEFAKQNQLQYFIITDGTVDYATDDGGRSWMRDNHAGIVADIYDKVNSIPTGWEPVNTLPTDWLTGEHRQPIAYNWWANASPFVAAGIGMWIALRPRGKE